MGGCGLSYQNHTSPADCISSPCGNSSLFVVAPGRPMLAFSNVGVPVNCVVSEISVWSNITVAGTEVAIVNSWVVDVIPDKAEVLPFQEKLLPLIASVPVAQNRPGVNTVDPPAENGLVPVLVTTALHVPGLPGVEQYESAPVSVAKYTWPATQFVGMLPDAPVRKLASCH